MKARSKNKKPGVLRRVLSCLVSAAMVVAFTPVVAWGEGTTTGNVTYLYCDANGANWTTGTKSASEYTEVTSSTTAWGTSENSESWYVVSRVDDPNGITIGSRVEVKGNVHLILMDGCKLTVNGGIQVQDNDNNPATPSTNSLTVYAQSTGTTMGTLIADARNNSGYAGIGGDINHSGGTITINGGTVKATSDSGAGIGGGNQGSGGTITINGGTVEATSTYGAGIGGGGSSLGGSGGGDGGSVTINGGSVTATSDSGAGIGGGYGGGYGGDGGQVTIYGGSVTATSVLGAGIGGGSGAASGGSGGNITINGGTVEATGEVNGAGIGGGYKGTGGTIEINGGRVEATGGVAGAGIGGGNNGNGGIITISGGTVNASGGVNGGGSIQAAGIGGGYQGAGDTINISGGTVTATSHLGAAIGGGQSKSGGSITISGGVVTATNTRTSTILPLTVAIGDGHSGSGGTFRTQEDNKSAGNAVIFASTNTSQSPISDMSGKTDGTWSGVIFEGDSGAVYGSPTLNSDLTFPGADGTATSNAKNLTVPAGSTLTIAENTTLTIASGGTLTNEGSIYVDGTLTGTGTVSGNGAVYYLLTLNADGGTYSGTTPTYYNSNADTTLPTPTKTGYTFEGWYKGDTKVDQIAKDSTTGPITLTAKWTINQYTISYDLKDGSLPAGVSNPTGYTVESAAISLNTPTKTGYTFTGWSGTGLTGDNNTIATIPAGSTGNRSYTAHWKLNQYTITFKDGDSTYQTITQDYGTSVSAPTEPTKTGYTFDGWDQEIPATMPAENVTITAQWTVNSYDVAFVTNGGSTIEPAKEKYGDKVTKPADPTREGYTFAGWYSDSELTTAWNFESNTMPAESITLYAKWLSQDTTVQKVTVKGVEGTIDNANRTVEVTLPYYVALPTDSGDFEIVTTSKASVTPPQKEEGWKFTVTAEDGKATAEYTITVKQQSAPYVPPTYDVPVTGEGSIAVKATVNGSTAVVAEISAKALESAAGSGAATITIDLSGLPKGVTSAQVSKTTLENLAAVVNDKGNAVESVTIVLGGAMLEIDADALSAIAGQVKGANVSLSVVEAKSDALNSAQQSALAPFDVVQLYFEAQIKSGNTEIHDFGGGSVRVSVAFELRVGHNPAFYKVLYVGEDGSIERYATTFADGKLSFLAPHFSAYAVVYMEDATQAAVAALEALPNAGELKLEDAEEAVEKAEAALEQFEALDAGQKALVDEALVDNAKHVVSTGTELIEEADAKAVKRVKDKVFSVKAGKSKSIAFKTKTSAAGTRVVYKKTKGNKYITVTKAGKVTAKKGLKAGKKYTVKVKVTCGKSYKYVKVTVKVRG